MTAIQDVLAILKNAGFAQLPKPLMVVDTAFDFEAAASGTNQSHDLVVIATDQVSRNRLRRLIAGLARSLDLAASRRPLSIVVIGHIAASDRIDLERYARVLPIRSDEPSIAEIEDAIAILLPLKIPNAKAVNSDTGSAISELMAMLDPRKTTADHLALVASAAEGQDVVRETLRRYANEGTGWNDEPGVRHE